MAQISIIVLNRKHLSIRKRCGTLLATKLFSLWNIPKRASPLRTLAINLHKKVWNCPLARFPINEQASSIMLQLFIWAILGTAALPAVEEKKQKKTFTCAPLIECIDLAATSGWTLESANVQSNQGLGRLADDACRSQATDRIQPLSDGGTFLFLGPSVPYHPNIACSPSKTLAFGILIIAAAGLSWYLKKCWLKERVAKLQMEGKHIFWVGGSSDGWGMLSTILCRIRFFGCTGKSSGNPENSFEHSKQHGKGLWSKVVNIYQVRVSTLRQGG